MKNPVAWSEYVRVITDGASGVAIAAKTGIPESTISRWLADKNPPKPDQAVAVARAYSADPLQALIAAGHLAASDLERKGEVPRRLQLRDFTDLELAEEMVRRVAGGSSPVLQDPLNGDHPAMKQLGD